MEHGAMSRLLRLWAARNSGRPRDTNDLAWWRDYVAEYFHPKAVVRLSVAALPIFSEQPFSVTEVPTPALPHLFKWKYDSGVVEESYFPLDWMESMVEGLAGRDGEGPTQLSGAKRRACGAAGAAGPGGLEGGCRMVVCKGREHTTFEGFVIVTYGTTKVVYDEYGRITLMDTEVSGYDLLVDHSALHGDLDRVSNDLAARATTLASLSALCTAPRTASGELAHGHGGGEAGSMHGGEGGGVGGGGAAARLEGALRETRVLLNQTASALREYGGKLDSYLSYEYDYIQGMLHRMQVADVADATTTAMAVCKAQGLEPRQDAIRIAAAVMAGGRAGGGGGGGAASALSGRTTAAGGIGSGREGASGGDPPVLPVSHPEVAASGPTGQGLQLRGSYSRTSQPPGAQSQWALVPTGSGRMGHADGHGHMASRVATHGSASLYGSVDRGAAADLGARHGRDTDFGRTAHEDEYDGGLLVGKAGQLEAMEVGGMAVGELIPVKLGGHGGHEGLRRSAGMGLGREHGAGRSRAAAESPRVFGTGAGSGGGGGGRLHSPQVSSATGGAPALDLGQRPPSGRDRGSGLLSYRSGGLDAGGQADRLLRQLEDGRGGVFPTGWHGAADAGSSRDRDRGAPGDYVLQGTSSHGRGSSQELRQHVQDRQPQLVLLPQQEQQQQQQLFLVPQQQQPRQQHEQGYGGSGGRGRALDEAYRGDRGEVLQQQQQQQQQQQGWAEGGRLAERELLGLGDGVGTEGLRGSGGSEQLLQLRLEQQRVGGNRGGGGLASGLRGSGEIGRALLDRGQSGGLGPDQPYEHQFSSEQEQERASQRMQVQRGGHL